MKIGKSSIWASCAAGLLIASSSIGQAPPESNTRSEMEWGQYLAKNPEVLGVHLARFEKTMEEQRVLIDELRGRIEALERRKNLPVNTVSMPFQVKDAKGRIRLLLAEGNDGESAMFLAGSDGQPRIGFSAEDDSAAIEIYGKDNTSDVRLHSDSGSGELHLINNEGRAIDLDGALGVRVRGKDGNAHVQLSSDGNGGQINVYEAKTGTSVVRMRTISTGAGRLTLSRADGEFVMDVGAATDGSGILKMGPNGNGAAASMTSAGRPASTLQGRPDAPGSGGGGGGD